MILLVILSSFLTNLKIELRSLLTPLMLEMELPTLLFLDNLCNQDLAQEEVVKLMSADLLECITMILSLVSS